MNFQTYESMYYMWTVNTHLPIFMHDKISIFQAHQPPKLVPENKNILGGEKSIEVKIEPETIKEQPSIPNKKKKSQKSTGDQEFEIQKSHKKTVLVDQKEGRNVVSNILRSFFKFIESPSSHSLFQKMPHHFIPSKSKKQMLSWFEENSIHYRNYIRWRSIENMMSRGREDMVRCFVFVLCYYLEHYAVTHFLCSQKLKQKNKMMTLKQVRVLKQAIFSKYQSLNL